MLDLNDQLDPLYIRIFSLFFLVFFLNSAGVNPSSIKLSNLQYHYYNGDAHDPNVQATIKENFYQLLTAPFVPPIFCQIPLNLCLKDEMLVYPGINGKSQTKACMD